MNILVIGNGFDIAHGLPTKYTDFLNWVINEYNFFLYMKEQDAEITKSVDNITLDVPKELLNKAKNMSHMQYDIQHELWRMINSNIWLEYFLNNPMYQKENWIDFESQISKVIQSLDNDMLGLSDYGSIDDNIMNLSNKFLCKKYSKYTNTVRSVNALTNGISEGITYKEIRNHLLTDLNRLIRAFEIYLIEYVGKINTGLRSPDIQQILPKESMKVEGIPVYDTYVLSFNYTNTYKRLYIDDVQENKYFEKYIDFIHGKADIKNTIDSNNMVLGIDEYLPKKRRNKDVKFIAFKKYYQRIHKQTGCKYKIWVDKIKQDYMQYLKRQEEADRREYTYISDSMQRMMNHLATSAIKEEKYSIHNLYFFGHSLDITDKDILRDLILNDNVHTTIFYLNKDVMGQQIANLVKVIGQDELIRRTGGSTKTIEFSQQKAMIAIK